MLILPLFLPSNVITRYLKTINKKIAFLIICSFVIDQARYDFDKIIMKAGKLVTLVKLEFLRRTAVLNFVNIREFPNHYWTFTKNSEHSDNLWLQPEGLCASVCGGRGRWAVKVHASGQSSCFPETRHSKRQPSNLCVSLLVSG